MLAVNGNHLILGIEGYQLTSVERQRFAALQPAGYIIFTRNIESPAQTRQLTDSLWELSDDPPIIAIDQEGGRVTRTSDIAPSLPSATELAAHSNLQTVAQAGALTGEILHQLGINLNFSPVLDIDHFPDLQNALNGRCWGGHSQKVIDLAGTWNRWLRKRGVFSCAKHFPAGGRATIDPHFDLPISEISSQEMLATDIVPYTALMPELDAVMTAHVLFPEIDRQLPASLSPKLINGLLRNQLGFDKHLVFTDDLDMGAIKSRFPNNTDVVAALVAGSDLAMICHEVERAEEAAAKIESIDCQTLEDSQRRIKRFRRKLLPPTPWSNENWKKTCEGISQLRTEVPVIAETSHSPVVNY